MFNSMIAPESLFEKMFQHSTRQAFYNLTNYKEESKKEDNEKIVFTYNLAGVDKKDINVEIQNNGLNIRYTKGDNDYTNLREYLGCYEYNSEKISATYKNGLLTITVPKTSKYTKKIEIQ